MNQLLLEFGCYRNCLQLPRERQLDIKKMSVQAKQERKAQL